MDCGERLCETLMDQWTNLIPRIDPHALSEQALKEIDELLKFLDGAECELFSAEPLTANPELLTSQLRDHRLFHEELETKQRILNETIARCYGRLKETTNEESEEIRNKLTNISEQAEIVCQISSNRLIILEEKLPLASYFYQTRGQLLALLNDVSEEIDTVIISADENIDQIKNKIDIVKGAQRLIDDHKALLNDLISTGRDLVTLSRKSDADSIQSDIDNVTSKYDNIKLSAKNKLLSLDNAVGRLTPDVNVALDSIVDDLYYLNGRAAYADPVAANPTTLRGQIAENNSIVEDLEVCTAALRNVKGVVEETLRRQSESSEEPNDELQSVEDLHGDDELRDELQSVEDLHTVILESTRQRSALLHNVVKVAEKFREEYDRAMQTFGDLRDDLMSQDLPGVDPETVRLQQEQLQRIVDSLTAGQQLVVDCRKTVDKLRKFCNEAAMTEIEKYTEDLEMLREEVEDGVKERRDVLRSALERAENYSTYYRAVISWLPQLESKLLVVSPIASHPRSVRIQIEEFKVLKIQMRPYHADIENLNQYMNELRTSSPAMAQTFANEVSVLNHRWSLLLGEFTSRESHLQEILVQLGEVNHSMDDVIGLLQQIEADLQQLDELTFDPGTMFLHLKKIQLELLNQEPVIRKLNDVVHVMVERSEKTSASLREKQQEMMNMYMTAQCIARDKLQEIHGRLKEVKGFVGSVDDLISWLGKFQTLLKSTASFGVLPQEMQSQHDAIMTGYMEICEKEGEANALMLNGEDMIARCKEKDALKLKAKLALLQEKLIETKAKADKRKRKLEEHMRAVEKFHKSFSTHTDWIERAERELATFKNRRKTVESILQQIQSLEELKKEIDNHNKLAGNIEHTGSYLKYFGCKRDTAYIKNLLVKVKLRWKKLVRRVDETGRHLQQAYRENKRFEENWKSLLDWLEVQEEKLKKCLCDAAINNAKPDMDEIHSFQVRMAQRHPVYVSTMRLGCNLRELCVGSSEPDKPQLSKQLDELKTKWNYVRSLASQKQVKFEEGLMSAGRLADALSALLDWLTKAEAYLLEDLLILGDVDTVNILIEKHKLFQQEVSGRKGMVEVILSTSGLDSSLTGQVDQLSTVWERVIQLTEAQESKLQESLKLAESFRDAVQVVREWLPEAEAELKFQSIPDDEEAIIQLIENHEKFQDELERQQENIDQIRSLADEILQSCHPNGIRFIKYYLTITQTRWEQAVSRSNQRAQRLQEALRSVRGNAALLDEMVAWLADCHALLTTKSKDSIPDDMTVVEVLFKEHTEFHEELSNKSKEVEQLIKTLSASGAGGGGTMKRGGLTRSSPSRHTEVVPPSPKAMMLQNKWKMVWKMSVERNKKLQDALARLVEVESCKNFDFEVWRQNYISWNRANKLKFMDFFRRQDRQGMGTLSKRDFIDGIMSSKFPTNATELNAVFNVLDTKRIGRIQYKTFVEAIMRPDKPMPGLTSGIQSISDGSQISQLMEDELVHCQCRTQFSAFKIDEGKYKFGDKDKIWHVRLMNGAVFVRFGSGWMPFEEFLDSNDPCRVKARITSSQARSGSTSNLSNRSSQLQAVPYSTASLPRNKSSNMTKSWSNLSSAPLSPLTSVNGHASLLSSSRLTTPRRSAVHSPTSMSPKRSTTPKSPQKSYAKSTPTSPSSSSGSLPKRSTARTANTSPGGTLNRDSSFTTSTWPRSPNRPPQTSTSPRSTHAASPRSSKNTLSSSTASSRSSGINASTPTDGTSTWRTRTTSGSKSTAAARSSSPDPKKLTSTSAASSNLFSLRNQTMNF